MKRPRNAKYCIRSNNTPDTFLCNSFTLINQLNKKDEWRRKTLRLSSQRKEENKLSNSVHQKLWQHCNVQTYLVCSYNCRFLLPSAASHLGKKPHADLSFAPKPGIVFHLFLYLVKNAKLYTFKNHIFHLSTGFCRVFVNCMSPLITEPINLSTSSVVMSPWNVANFLFRGLYATNNLSKDLNPDFSNAVRNVGYFVASKRLYEILSLEPKAEFCLLDSVFWETCEQKIIE